MFLSGGFAAARIASEQSLEVSGKAVMVKSINIDPTSAHD